MLSIFVLSDPDNSGIVQSDLSEHPLISFYYQDFYENKIPKQLVSYEELSQNTDFQDTYFTYEYSQSEGS